MREIGTAADRAASLTRQLLAFSRNQVLQPRRLDVNRTIADLGGLIRRLIGEDVTVRQELAPGLWEIFADPSQLEQVVMNLVVNARDAMPRGGVLVLATRNVSQGEQSEQGEQDAPGPGDYVVVEVSDTGVGMTEDVRQRIFDPFFTTKDVGRGTGLGLSTIYGIVQQSAGAITVRSAPGQGSTFAVYLPRARESEAAEPAEAPRASPDITATVLLVEDEPPVRTVARRALERKGHRVLEASCANEALDLLAQHLEDVQILVTDVVMPGMNGKVLAEAATRMRPGLPVLFVSGYTEEEVVHRGVLHAEVALLQKPFSAQDLTSSVRDVLVAARSG